MPIIEIIKAIADLATRAARAGLFDLYRDLESVVWVWVNEELEWVRDMMIDAFPWGLDL